MASVEVAHTISGAKLPKGVEKRAYASDPECVGRIGDNALDFECHDSGGL